MGMQKHQIGTAAAAFAVAGTLGCMGAEAAPVSFNLTFVPLAPTTQGSGTGTFTVDDSVLIPDNAISEISAVSAFTANFVDVPGIGALAFDLADLASINLKTDSSGALYALSFSTTTSATDPYLQAGIFFSNFIYDPDVSMETPVAEYTTQFEQVDGPATIDEPGALALLAAGAAGIPLIRRRRKTAARSA